MKQAGMGTHEIARRFGMTSQAVSAAVRRQLEKLNREALLAYPEVLRMELERLDALQQSIWPLTQHRKVALDDGTEMQVEPDLKAVAEVRSIMAARAKLLGLDQVNVSVSLDTGNNVMDQTRVILAESGERPASVSAFSPETEARQLLELMGASGVLPESVVNELLGTKELSPIVDAEIIEGDEDE
jgi:hypothetical protein